MAYLFPTNTNLHKMLYGYKIVLFKNIKHFFKYIKYFHRKDYRDKKL